MFFIWMMGELLALQKYCVGDYLKGGSQPDHGWLYKAHQEIFNPYHKLQDHRPEPSLTLRKEFMGWHHRIDETTPAGL